MNSILMRMILGFLAFLCILGGILFTTITVTEQQKDDGLIVNLSGRQRMLTQKMTKEVLIFSSMAQNKTKRDELDKWKEQLDLTMEVFETTLYALKDGGEAPLNLWMTQFRETPSAGTEMIREQLNQVVELWLPFRDNIQVHLDSNGNDSQTLDYIISNNVELLANMNKAVFQMQAEAERKVALMVKIQTIAVGIGLIICILSIFIIKASIVNPILNLIKAAEAMSRGNLKDEIEVSGLKEVSALALSLNRMRVSLVKVLEKYYSARK